jgi:hypothetical protein
MRDRRRRCPPPLNVGILADVIFAVFVDDVVEVAVIKEVLLPLPLPRSISLGHPRLGMEVVNATGVVPVRRPAVANVLPVRDAREEPPQEGGGGAIVATAVVAAAVVVGVGVSGAKAEPPSPRSAAGAPPAEADEAAMSPDDDQTRAGGGGGGRNDGQQQGGGYH